MRWSAALVGLALIPLLLTHCGHSHVHPAPLEVPAVRGPDLGAALTLMKRSGIRTHFSCTDRDGRQSSIAGSGVVVSRAGHILTASHLARCEGRLTVHVGPVIDDFSPITATIPADLIEIAGEGDLALIKTREPLRAEHVAALETTYEPAIGTPTRVVGFSDLPFQPKDREVVKDRAPSVQIYESVLQSATLVGRRLKWLHYSGNTLDGTSGAGIWTVDGHLIGIHKGYWFGNINGLLSEEDHARWGNSITFKDGDGTPRRVTLDYKALRQIVVEAFMRGTSIQYVPDEWLAEIRRGGVG